ncbi:hypothetical protein HYFRA_00003787 [Hymenoscyphus fraxineus]|uniref:Uncharacterized protein n=1 Tax=Hymenoscyphus fraxineus TaxID=746836 RepID=A0A9N9PJY7_9HELO|nr:hypothetical protein HYFRA_00003787 [Hymenoscyphus fraxineus]
MTSSSSPPSTSNKGKGGVGKRMKRSASLKSTVQSGNSQSTSNNPTNAIDSLLRKEEERTQSDQDVEKSRSNRLRRDWCIKLPEPLDHDQTSTFFSFQHTGVILLNLSSLTGDGGTVILDSFQHMVTDRGMGVIIG